MSPKFTNYVIQNRNCVPIVKFLVPNPNLYSTKKEMYCTLSYLLLSL